MPYICCSSLPTSDQWSFDAIAADCSQRAKFLEEAGTPPDLVGALVSRLSSALDRTDLRLGYEQAEANPADYRVVIQFEVGRNNWDWFFNARTGYRAHFRAHYTCGLAFNDFIVEGLRRKLLDRLPPQNTARELRGRFEDCGEVSIDRDFIVSSLEPSHSKIWFCGKRIRRGGGTEYLMPSLSGPRIALNQGESWAAVYQEDGNAWLDLKGVFVRGKCKYQTKDPIRRALSLERTGTPDNLKWPGKLIW